MVEEVEKGVGGSEVKRGMGNIEQLDENWQIRLTDKGEGGWGGGGDTVAVGQ